MRIPDGVFALNISAIRPDDSSTSGLALDDIVLMQCGRFSKLNYVLIIIINSIHRTTANNCASWKIKPQR